MIVVFFFCISNCLAYRVFFFFKLITSEKPRIVYCYEHYVLPASALKSGWSFKIKIVLKFQKE